MPDDGLWRLLHEPGKPTRLFQGSHEWQGLELVTIREPCWMDGPRTYVIEGGFPDGSRWQLKPASLVLAAYTDQANKDYQEPTSGEALTYT